MADDRVIANCHGKSRKMEKASMQIDKNTWDLFQKHLKYSDAQMQQFMDNQVNAVVLSKSSQLVNKTIVAEVVAAGGCNSQHRIGDRFYFDGSGNLLTKLCPKRICIYILQPMAQIIYGISELAYAGVDPNSLKFRYAGCFDVGVEYCGWGRVIVKVTVEDRDKAN